MEIKQSGGDVNWNVDKDKSGVKFKIRYLLTSISGSFKNYDISVTTLGENFSTAQITFTADLLSINTNDPERDNDIINSELLKDLNSRTMEFISGRLEKTSEHNFRVYGNLKLFDTTKTVIFDMNFIGLSRTPGDKVNACLTINGKIRYMDFIAKKDKPGIGSLFISDEAEIQVTVFADKP